MHEARIEDTPAGRVPADDGWCVLNLGEIAAPAGGTPDPLPLRRLGGHADRLAREAYADMAPLAPARSPWPLEPM